MTANVKCCTALSANKVQSNQKYAHCSIVQV